MEPGIFKYILRYSRKEQLLLVLMTALSLPFLYYSYDLPKIIVNKAIGGTDFPALVLGAEFEQIPFLLFLCGIFLALVFVNGGFKYAVNVYRGIVGERMLRRLRFMLIERTLRFPLPHFRTVSQGEIVSMVTTETEPLGGFIGDSFSLLAHQGGALVVPLVFIFVQDPLMGLAAIALYPVQAYLIPKLQRRVNKLGKERVQTVRKVSERIGETVAGVQDIHAHYTYQYELADFSGYLGKIFEIRNKIYRLKFFIKFLNNFLAQLTPFFFYSIGGYFVIKGELTFGALLAVIAAYKDLAAPWKELLTYYQRMEDARIKYQQLIEQFEVPGMLDETLVAPPDEVLPPLSGPVVASNLSLELEEGSRVVDGASFTFDSAEHVALVGGGGSGKTEIANLLARQIVPTGGKISIGDTDLATLPEAVTGRDIGYVDQDAYIRSGTIEENLLYSLKHLPTNGAAEGGNGADRPHWLREAMASGNSEFDPNADWVDVDAVDGTGLGDRIVRSLRSVGLVDGVFRIGLRRVVDPDLYPGLVEGVLAARSVVRERLGDPALADLVEVFQGDHFIANASVAENILFGTPVGEAFAIDTLGRNPHVMQVLERVGIAEDFVQIGRSVAALMVELFQDLPPGHEFFERFSFVASEDLPEFQRMLNVVGTRGLDGIDEADRARFRDLPFKLVVARHHLGLIGRDMEEKLLEARRTFAETLPEEMAGAVEFFDAERYSRSSSIQDNILFGKVAGTKGDSAEMVGELISEVVDKVGLRDLVLEIGLDFDVGIGGKRLNSAQRQQLAVARCLIKSPQMMIVNEAASSLDPSARLALYEGVRETMRGRGLVWVDTEPMATDFDRVLTVDYGRVRGAEGEGHAHVPAEQAAPAPRGPADGLTRDAELLAGIAFFAGMDRSRLKLIAFTSERLTYRVGQDIILQGDLGDRAYVVLDGAVDVVVDLVDGPEVVASLGKGDLFGELALLCDAPRTATIRAREDTTVLSISKDVFLKVVEENSALSANVARIVAGRLHAAMRHYSAGHSIYDDVTGLPRRGLLFDRVRYEVARSQRVDETPMLMMVHLGGANGGGPVPAGAESHGVLTELAERLRRCVRTGDTVAYLDGMRFGILMSDVKDPGNVRIVGDRITEILGVPLAAAGAPADLAVNLQFETYPVGEDNLDELKRICLEDRP